ncbi:hypothetical protein [Yimella sp. cx-51]|uniref:hypothetical protein n=1 Tax=Yimella sp. cx-51 TaxID=2770551 RepID=UPI00165DB74C|nr:hypothetical protein [Yimella sp. cx-51]MBC9957607.1 hypothetical protein [Yimella sp. cx-51]MBD2758649.1 hypothetical protein [Yimella sp. cx-573]QTH37033.1 hypothetical protein J5M86_08875 [Yimella sp. cx-51]
MTDRTEDDQSDAAAAVAQEAMKLVESLGAWAGSASSAHAFESSAGGGSDRDDDEPKRGDDGCSCSTAHAPVVCRVCPVCRVGAFLEGLSPEAMERIADLIGMVAGSLQAVAQERRAGSPSGEESRPPAGQPASHKVTVSGDEPESERDIDPQDSAE